MTETMPSANEGGFSKYSSYETIYETPAKTSRNLENNENEEKSVAITTEAGNQRLDSDSELKAIDPSQGNRSLSKDTSTGSSDTVSNNLSNPALCEALVNDWQRLVSDGLPMKRELSASGEKSKSLPRSLATQTSRLDFAFNLMAEVEWDNIEEKLNNHRLSKIGADIAETGAGGGASSEGDEEMDQEAHDRKQANMQSQLQSLNDMLSQKEALASNMMANEEKMQEMRDKYEKSLASLQEELATLQQEKDKLDIQTKSSKNNDPTCKISEQRRKRIQDLENQVSTNFNAIKQ